MAERSNATVLKTVMYDLHREFKSHSHLRGLSSVGRAFLLQRKGQEFEALILQKKPEESAERTKRAKREEARKEVAQK